MAKLEPKFHFWSAVGEPMCRGAGSDPLPNTKLRHRDSKGSVGLTLHHTCGSRLTQKGDQSEQQLCRSWGFLGIYIASLGKNKAEFKLLPCSCVTHYEKVS